MMPTSRMERVELFTLLAAISDIYKCKAGKSFPEVAFELNWCILQNSFREERKKERCLELPFPQSCSQKWTNFIFSHCIHRACFWMYETYIVSVLGGLHRNLEQGGFINADWSHRAGTLQMILLPSVCFPRLKCLVMQFSHCIVILLSSSSHSHFLHCNVIVISISLHSPVHVQHSSLMSTSLPVGPISRLSLTLS